MTLLLIDNKLNKPVVEHLLHRPDCGIRRVPVDEFRFGSTLPHIRNERGLHYHPEHFFIDLQYRALWIRAGVYSANGGWCWKVDIYKAYSDLGIETTSDLLFVLGKYIPVVRHLPTGVSHYI